MSLTVKHLNADSSFLLTFRPLPQSDSSSPFPPSPGPPPSSFSIVIDPWLTGPSTIFSSSFATARHRILPCIASLRDLPEPDLVIVSQATADHCHEETLRQLPSDEKSKTLILASPGAAKIIKSWNHFRPAHRVQSLGQYNAKRSEKTIRRFTIPALTPAGEPGEVTVAFMKNRADITGVHTAIGITYRPPTSSAETHPLPSTVSSDIFPPTPPESPFSDAPLTAVSTTSSPSPPGTPPISIIYAPHGVSYSRVIQPYAANHLLPLGAIPLTLLLHSFHQVMQPWWLGGTISTGVLGGMKIANALMAKHWISAHDEEKHLEGFVDLEMVRTRKFKGHEVDRLRTGIYHWTEMIVLESGEEWVVDGGNRFHNTKQLDDGMEWVVDGGGRFQRTKKRV